MNGKVLIAQPIFPVGEAFLAAKGYTVLRASGSAESDLVHEIAGCDALLVRNARVTPAVIDAGKKLKVIGRHGVGVDTIDVAYAREKGIVVTNAPLSNTNAVAEHTLFLILSCAKNARKIDIAFRGGDFGIRDRVVNVELSGKTLAILGMGRIGRTVAAKAVHGFGMRVVGYDPYVSADTIDENIALCRTLADAVKGADFVTVHLPLTGDTRGIVNRELFSVMKRGGYLINAARGEVVNEADLLEALDSGMLAGGAFDLLAQEPPPANHPLFQYENVILTPHNAAHTMEAFENMALHAAQGIHDVLSGRAPEWPVI